MVQILVVLEACVAFILCAFVLNMELRVELSLSLSTPEKVNGQAELFVWIDQYAWPVSFLITCFLVLNQCRITAVPFHVTKYADERNEYSLFIFHTQSLCSVSHATFYNDYDNSRSAFCKSRKMEQVPKSF